MVVTAGRPSGGAAAVVQRWEVGEDATLRGHGEAGEPASGGSMTVGQWRGAAVAGSSQPRRRRRRRRFGDLGSLGSERLHRFGLGEGVYDGGLSMGLSLLLG